MSNEVITGHHDDHAHHDAGAMKIYGFWIYILSDLILFATLFATYAVMHHSYAGGVTAKIFLNCHTLL